MASILLGDHQVEAVELGCKALNEDSRAQVIMACGTGKTLVGYTIAANLNAKKILILVPSLALISQTMLAWASFGNDQTEKTICVCSDVDFSEDSTIDYPQENIKVETTTDREIISNFIERNSLECVLFCTYHSSLLLSESLPPGFKFDLAVFDEAHRTAGHADKSFSLLLKNHKNVAIDKRLFLTATPKQILIEENDNSKYFSMDDEEVYGKVAYQLSLREAIERGIICDYEILVSVMPTDSAPDQMRDDNYLPSINAIELEKAMYAVNAKKAFTFHSRVSEAAIFSQVTNSIGGNIKAFHVNGKMPRNEREQQLKEFIKHDTSVISNAKCLSEGVDLPAVDMVGLMSPRDSAIDIVQIIGRALRKASGKTTGYIFLPIRLTINDNEELSQAISRTNMDHVWRVIKSLSDQDEEISLQFSAARREYINKGVIGNYDWFSKIQIQAPEEIKDHFRRLLEIQVVKRFTESWTVNFEQLKIYIDKSGKYPKTSSGLGRWLTFQRAQYNRNELKQDRILKFKEAGISFKPLEDAWDSGFKELLRYKFEHGNLDVPDKFITKSGFKLGQWVGVCRYRPLTMRRKIKLTSIGFVFKKLDTRWEQGFNLVKKYLEEHGHHSINNNKTTNDQHNNVAVWIQTQKRKFKSGTMSAYRIQRLSEIGIYFTK